MRWWLAVKGGPMDGCEFYDGLDPIEGRRRVNLGTFPDGHYMKNGLVVWWVANR